MVTLAKRGKNELRSPLCCRNSAVCLPYYDLKTHCLILVTQLMPNMIQVLNGPACKHTGVTKINTSLQYEWRKERHNTILHKQEYCDLFCYNNSILGAQVQLIMDGLYGGFSGVSRRVYIYIFSKTIHL